MKRSIISISVVLFVVLFCCTGVLTVVAEKPVVAPSGDIWIHKLFPIEERNNFNSSLAGTSGNIESSGKCGDNVFWTLDDTGTLRITGSGDITSHGWDSSKVQSVEIGSGVTSIGSNAFFGCTNLRSIIIPDSVTSINDHAFQNCSNLTSITIPDSVTSIGPWIFNSCSRLTSINIPDAVTSIGNGTFFGCSSLTSIAIPDGVTTIGESAFSGCSSLTNITIPDGVTSIGECAFSGCSSLTNINIPDGVTNIGYSTFWGCRCLTNINISNCITSIGSQAFSGCSSLTNITIPDGGTSIGSGAFYGCSNLTSISIPDGVTSIGDEAFSRCSSLTGINISDCATSIGHQAFSGCSSLTSINIPDGVTSIGYEAFYNCNAILYCSLDSAAAYALGKQNYAFRANGADLRYLFENDSVSGLELLNIDKTITFLTLPDGITSIGSHACDGCNTLASINIPDSVTSIGDHAFKNCSSLTDITIPNGIISIETSTFYGCSSLTSITIPDGVTSIGSNAFLGCSNLISIGIPDSVISIGSCAFNTCSSLTSINIPDGVTSIGRGTFYDCNSLTGISIPDSVTSIGDMAFLCCSSLTSITIPDGVTSIGNMAFDGCDKLNNICFMQRDTITVSFGTNICITTPTIYCYEYSDADSWATDQGYTVVYLDTLDYESIQTISLPDDKRVAVDDSFTILPFIFPDNHPVIYWSSSDDSVLTVDSHGFVTALAPGKAAVTASIGASTDSMEITVCIQTISLPDDKSMAVGDSFTILPSIFPDNHPDICWSSSDDSVLTVDSHGLVTALAPGKATVTASIGTSSDSMEITVYALLTSFDLNIEEEWLIAKDTIQLECTNLIPEDAVAVINWSSSDTTLATVDENGLVTTKKPGDVVISADTENGIHRECLLHLCYPVTEIAIAPVDYVVVGTEYQLTANVTMRSQSCVNHLVNFSSSNTDVAEVSNNGVLHGKMPGEVTITATAKSGITQSVSVTVISSGNAVYEWADDNHTVTAWIILADTHERQEETVITTVAVSKSPSANESGIAIYSAVFTNSAFSRQEKEIDIPAWKDMKLLTLPNGTQSIETEAFCGIAAEAVIIPDGCSSIGSKAFANCEKLRYVWIPNSVLTVSDDAFIGDTMAILDYE